MESDCTYLLNLWLFSKDKKWNSVGTEVLSAQKWNASKIQPFIATILYLTVK